MGKLLQDLDPRNNPSAPKIVNPSLLAVAIIDGKFVPPGTTTMSINNQTEQPLELYTASAPPYQLLPYKRMFFAPTGAAVPAYTVVLPVFSNAPDYSSNANKPPMNVPPTPLDKQIFFVPEGFGADKSINNT